MLEPPVSNNLSYRSEDFFFFTSAQLDAQFRNTQSKKALVRFAGHLQTATSRYVWQVEQKNPCSLSASPSWAIQECQCFPSFFDGPPTSPNECQVFRDIWWKPKPVHCPMLSARLLFWASCSLDMCPLMRFTRPPPFLARSCCLSFAFWARRLPTPFFLGHRQNTG